MDEIFILNFKNYEANGYAAWFSVPGDFGAQSVKILVFPNPTNYML